MSRSYNPAGALRRQRFGLFPGRSPLLGESLLFSLPGGTKMFQFRRFPSCTYFVQYRIPYGGFPHSEISGSMLICSSPKLIAAYHVLHRLLMPRHSPCALFRLTFVETMRQIPSSIHTSWLCLLDSLAPSFLLLKFKPARAGL